MTHRYYVGFSMLTSNPQVFRHHEAPTAQSHGQRFGHCVGPFRTKRGAEYMARHGRSNPHCTTVAEAERLAAKAEG